MGRLSLATIFAPRLHTLPEAISFSQPHNYLVLTERYEYLNSPRSRRLLKIVLSNNQHYTKIISLEFSKYAEEITFTDNRKSRHFCFTHFAFERWSLADGQHAVLLKNDTFCSPNRMGYRSISYCSLLKNVTHQFGKILVY